MKGVKAMQKDAQLIEQTLKGNEKAFQQLILKYYKVIYGQVFSIAQNHSDTEELVNDVFVKAYVNLSSLRQPSGFYSWLSQIAQHHCLDWVRRNSAKNRDISLLSLDEISNKMDNSVDSFVDEMIEQEKLDKVIEAINSLPEKDKVLMRDYYLNEMSHKELQVRHSLSEDAVKQRLARSRQKIRESLKYLFSWVGMSRYKGKALKGEAKTMSAGMKIAIIIGIAVLMFSGTSFLIWNHQQAKKGTHETTLTETTEQIPSQSTNKESSRKRQQTKSIQTGFSNNNKKSQTIELSEENSTPNSVGNKNNVEAIQGYGTVKGFVKSSIRVLDNSPNGWSLIHNPLVGAIVTAENQTLLASEGGKRSAKTDADGNYEITNLPKGRYTIIASISGFHDDNTSVIIESAGVEVFHDFWMIPLSEPPITNVEYVPVR
jgi:RNA polymerase sigma factor (sigma-70 family)